MRIIMISLCVVLVAGSAFAQADDNWKTLDAKELNKIIRPVTNYYDIQQQRFQAVSGNTKSLTPEAAIAAAKKGELMSAGADSVALELYDGRINKCEQMVYLKGRVRIIKSMGAISGGLKLPAWASQACSDSAYCDSLYQVKYGELPRANSKKQKVEKGSFIDPTKQKCNCTPMWRYWHGGPELQIFAGRKQYFCCPPLETTAENLWLKTDAMDEKWNTGGYPAFIDTNVIGRTDKFGNFELTLTWQPGMHLFFRQPGGVVTTADIDLRQLFASNPCQQPLLELLPPLDYWDKQLEMLIVTNMQKHERKIVAMEFTNSGVSPLKIISVHGGKSCTMAEFPEEKIAPGGKSQINLYFDCDFQQGIIQTGSFTVRTNNANNPTSVIYYELRRGSQD